MFPLFQCQLVHHHMGNNIFLLENKVKHDQQFQDFFKKGKVRNRSLAFSEKI